LKYAITIQRTARKQLGRIQQQDRVRIIEAIRGLADNPRPSGSIKLSGRPAWRIRTGPYRVIYEINDSQALVVVILLGPRKDIYR
jgi:mRNA interferase RelE/StbE